jgi:hypothetical protein
MVMRAGFEPATVRSEVACSNQLSSRNETSAPAEPVVPARARPMHTQADAPADDAVASTQRNLYCNQAGWTRTNNPRDPSAALRQLSYSLRRAIDGIRTRSWRLTTSRASNTPRSPSPPLTPPPIPTQENANRIPRGHAAGRIRTCTERILNPSPLPVGLRRLSEFHYASIRPSGDALRPDFDHSASPPLRISHPPSRRP